MRLVRLLRKPSPYQYALANLAFWVFTVAESAKSFHNGQQASGIFFLMESGILAGISAYIIGVEL